MRAKEMMTARTDERPVLKLAQWRLIKEKLWLDWSRVTSVDSWLISLETERSASLWNSRGGACVVDVDVLSHPTQ